MVLRYASKFVNRNPRNLELLGLQRKPTGWEFDKNARLKNFIYKIELAQGKSSQTARLFHYTDGVVIEASSSEPAISSQLYSKVDTCAAMNLGRVMAVRCLQSGIHFVHPAATEEQRKQSEHQREFFKALEEGGVNLFEPDAVEHSQRTDEKFTWKRYPVPHTREDKLDEK